MKRKRGNRYKGIPFESLWERIARATGSIFVCRKLQDFLASGTANHNHSAIAKLINAGSINTIFTTNYDEYIEEAFYKSKDSMFSYNQPHSRKPAIYHIFFVNQLKIRLIKLHGTFSIPSSLAFMFPQITNAFSKSSASRFKKILLKSPVIFCGYGFNDWDLQFLYSSMKSQKFVVVRPGKIPAKLRIEQNSNIMFYEDDLLANHNILTKLANFFEKRTTVSKATLLSNVLDQKNKDVPNYYRNSFKDIDKVQSDLSANDEKNKDITEEIFYSLSDEKKIETLGEILESLSLSVAKDVFDLVVKVKREKGEPSTYYECKVLFSSHHSGDFSYSLTEINNLLLRSDLTSFDKAWIHAEMFFILSMTRETFAAFSSIKKLMKFGFSTTIWLFRLLPRATMLLTVNKWNDEQKMNAEKFSFLLQILSHQFIRLPVSILSRVGDICIISHLIRFTAIFPFLTLLLNKWFLRRMGSLDLSAHQNREEGHVLMLLGFVASARKCISKAIKAYDWGHWPQMQVNGLRSLGWLNLRMGLYSEARKNFEQVEYLSRKYGEKTGEMFLDHIKSLFELKRLNKLENLRDKEFDKYLKKFIRLYASTLTKTDPFMLIEIDPWDAQLVVR